MGLAALGAAKAARTGKPNFVVIFLDDSGWADFTPFGHPNYPTPNVEKLARVGDYRTPSGGTMVYYALDGGGQSVGYIVYLGQDGKVLKIE